MPEEEKKKEKKKKIKRDTTDGQIATLTDDQHTLGVASFSDLLSFLQKKNTK
jgi:hypothetical protein